MEMNDGKLVCKSLFEKEIKINYPPEIQLIVNSYFETYTALAISFMYRYFIVDCLAKDLRLMNYERQLMYKR